MNAVSEWIKRLGQLAYARGYRDWYDPQLLPQLCVLWDHRVESAIRGFREEFLS